MYLSLKLSTVLYKNIRSKCIYPYINTAYKTNKSCNFGNNSFWNMSNVFTNYINTNYNTIIIQFIQICNHKFP